MKKFQRKILDWYKKNGRHDLPWRFPALKLRPDGSHDPYAILVSEVMLQQTQVDRALTKYKEFLKNFPTVSALARARTDAVLKVWSGLGYNRRALSLQKTARAIVERRGIFPRTTDELQQLPGVGPYTASAVAVFAFNSPEIVIETNIRRVFLHTFFTDAKGKIKDEDLMPLLKKALYTNDPRTWYSALMDYGALALKDTPNANRRSALHVRQSRFEGSRRYARAHIVRYLLKVQRRVPFQELYDTFQGDARLEPHSSSETIHDIIHDLASEGFLNIKKGSVSLVK